MISSWVRNTIKKRATRINSKKSKAPRCRLHVEVFEDRTVPAALSNPYLLTGDTALSPAVGTQNQARIAHGNQGYLAVWTDTRTSQVNGGSIYFGTGLGTMTDIYAARLNEAGQVIDTTPTVVSQAEFHQSMPKVAWNGQNYLVAWSSEHENDRYKNDVLAARVAPDGTVLDSTPIVLAAGTTMDFRSTWDVASDGTNWAVVWQGLDSTAGIFTIDGARVSANGTVMDAGGKRLRRDFYNSYPTKADIVFAGDEYLLTWIESNSAGNVRAQRLTAALDPIGANFTIGATGQTTQVASNGTDFLVTWTDMQTSVASVYGRRVSHAGAVLDAAPLVIADTAGYSATSADVAWDGTNYVVAYENSVTPNIDLYAARVTSSGTVLDPAGQRITSTSGYEQQPALAMHTGGGVQVVWSDSRSDASDVYSLPISATLVPGAETAVDLGAPRQLVARMAAGADGFLSVFTSEISGQSRILAERLNAVGVPIGAEPLLLTTNGVNPSVAWNGNEYLAVWQSGSQIYRERIAADGSLLDANPLLVTSGTNPDVAALGSDFLVTATFAPVIQRQYVVATRIANDGTIASGPVQVGVDFARFARVSTLGNRWLVVWQQSPTHDSPVASIQGAFVNPDGTPTGQFAVSSGSYPYQTRPALATNGTTALVVWQFNNNVMGRRIAADGTFLDGADGFVITGAPEGQFAPSATWDGTEFVVTWIDQRNEPFPLHPRGDIYAARVGADGVVLDPAGFAVANAAVPEETPTVVSGGGVTIFGYSAFVQAPPHGNMRISLRATDSLGAPRPPASLTATALSTSQMQLSWGDVSGESSYSLERSADGVSGWTVVATTTTNSTAWRDSSLTAGSTYYYRVRGVNEFGYGAYSAVASDATLTGPPLTVANVRIDSGAAQRSVIRSLTVSFSGVATVGANAFGLIRTGSSNSPVALSVSTEILGGQTVATLTFADNTDAGGSLVDGRYSLTVHSDRVNDGTGHGMDGDGDGLVGGDYVVGSAQGLFRLFGDVNGDAIVNGLDFGLFKNAFGTQLGDPNYLAYFDVNADNVINGFDFGQFRTRFGTMLP